MISAVAIGQVAKGDKSDRDAMARLNSGTVTDIVEYDGDDDTGADAHTEVKVPSPFTSAHRAGKGTETHGGTPTSVGHLYAHGNTDEPFRVSILGVKRKGRRRDGPFDHRTGRGWVEKKKGKYEHALSQGARVSPFIVETTGAISPLSLPVVSRLSRRARGKNARDGTKYGRSRRSTKSYFVHHTQRLSMTAACEDVRGIFKSITALKQSNVAGTTVGSAAGAA